MPLSPLTALSPLDGRYARATERLRPWFSELALIRYRVRGRDRMADRARRRARHAPRSRRSPRTAAPSCAALVADFSEADGERVKAIEAQTNHDVKAIEYWLKERLAERSRGSQRASEFIHFACTSEDINNLAYALMLAQAPRRGAAARAGAR